MKKLKKAISLLLVVLLTINIISINSLSVFADSLQAEENITQQGKGQEQNNKEKVSNKEEINDLDNTKKEYQGKIENPIYKGQEIEELYTPTTKSRSMAIASTPKFKTTKEASQYVKEQMVKRNGIIKFTISKAYDYKTAYDIINKAIEDNKNGNSSEGDYLRRHWSDTVWVADTSSKSTTFTFTIKYLSTYYQEQQVNREVKRVLDELDVYNKDEFIKSKAVHDYIAENITYDYSMKKYSAYNGIINKKVVCNGFSALTYKMMKDLDMDVRCITGYSSGEYHAWNISKIGTGYYNIDNTWDSCYTEESRQLDYTCFLKNNKDFSDHKRDSCFNTKSFNSTHPMSNTSYKLPNYYNVNQCKTSSIKDYSYIGKSIKPKITVSYKGKTLKEGKDYLYEYGKNTSIGKGSINIIGMGDFTGSKKLTFKILPGKISGLKQTSNTTSSIKLSWKKTSNISGYRIYRATSKNGKYTSVATISKNSTTTYTNKKLGSGKNYYYKMRAYKNIGNKKEFGPYSSILSAGTKCSTPKISAKSPKTKNVKVSWKKTSGAKGYRVYRASSKRGTYKKVAEIRKGSTLSFTDKKVKKKKVYYYKLRSYNLVNGSENFSSYSSPKYVKVK